MNDRYSRLREALTALDAACVRQKECRLYLERCESCLTLAREDSENADACERRTREALDALLAPESLREDAAPESHEGSDTVVEGDSPIAQATPPVAPEPKPKRQRKTKEKLPAPVTLPDELPLSEMQAVIEASKQHDGCIMVFRRGETCLIPLSGDQQRAAMLGVPAQFPAGESERWLKHLLEGGVKVAVIDSVLEAAKAQVMAEPERTVTVPFVCSICGVCSTHCDQWNSPTLCQGCSGFEPLGLHLFVAGAETCQMHLFAHADGRAIGRAKPDKLGTWHQSGEQVMHSPTATELLDAVGPLVGSRLASLEVSELPDGTLVLAFAPATVQEAGA